MTKCELNFKIEFLCSKNSEQLYEYNNFINNHPNGSFFQCSDWGKVKRNWQSEIIVVRGDDGKIRGGALILIKNLSPSINIPIKKSMLYVPRGPVCDYSDETVFYALLNGIKDAAKRHHAAFFV